MARRIHCAGCTANFIEVPDDAQLAPDFSFRCRACCPHMEPVRLTAQPKPKGLRVAETGERLPPGFQSDRKTPKPIKCPEWSSSDSFLVELFVDYMRRSHDWTGKERVLLYGRWRQRKTFAELANELDLTLEEVRKTISVLRTVGNRLWKRKQRAEAKAAKIAQLVGRAKDLSERGHSVRKIARAMGVSVGYASELRRASELRLAA